MSALDLTAAIDCVFCRIVAGTEPAQILHRVSGTLAIVPLNPVVPGHILVMPTIHVTDFTERPSVTAAVMHQAAWLAQEIGGACNLITSKGKAATQSVFHLHVHLVPRKENDGLALPWYSGRRSLSKAQAVLAYGIPVPAGQEGQD